GAFDSSSTSPESELEEVRQNAPENKDDVDGKVKSGRNPLEVSPAKQDVSCGKDEEITKGQGKEPSKRVSTAKGKETWVIADPSCDPGSLSVYDLLTGFMGVV
ncbi:hypothetical protein GX48_08120, partial [Paracoccidioides brasiliensis]